LICIHSLGGSTIVSIVTLRTLVLLSLSCGGKQNKGPNSRSSEVKSQHESLEPIPQLNSLRYLIISIFTFRYVQFCTVNPGINDHGGPLCPTTWMTRQAAIVAATAVCGPRSVLLCTTAVGVVIISGTERNGGTEPLRLVPDFTRI